MVLLARRPKEVLVNVGRLALLAGAILLVGSTAHAQTQVPPPQRPASPAAPASASSDDWTGIYAGGNLGGASTSFSGPVSFSSFAFNGTTMPGESVAIGPVSSGSGTIGLQAGYAAHLTRTLIGGLEFQITRASPTVSVTAGDQAKGLNYFIPADTFAMKGGAMKSLRGRLGAAMAPDLLVYGTLGVAFTTVTANGTFPVSGSFPAAAGTDIHTMKGVTIGAGAEYAPFKTGTLRAISIGAEFRHASLGTVSFDFGNVDIFQPPPVFEPAIGVIKVSANEFDVRINVRFGAWK
jgi:opacity protein-like surface antigen